MASAFSHIVIPIALSIPLQKNKIGWRLLVLGMIMSVLPDIDVLAFHFGIPYSSPFGHRGFTHSIFFAVLCATLFTQLADRMFSTKRTTFVFLFLSMFSHDILDALTNGGLGIAFFWPFDSTRYFLPWKVVEVSPIGAERFFTSRGIMILKSEFVYIWLPSFAFAITTYLINRIWRKSRLDNQT